MSEILFCNSWISTKRNFSNCFSKEYRKKKKPEKDETEDLFPQTVTSIIYLSDLRGILSFFFLSFFFFFAALNSCSSLGI